MNNVIIVYLILVLGGSFGYFDNIYKLLTKDVSGTNTTNALIVRGIGVFVPPLGAIAGYVDFDSEKVK